MVDLNMEAERAAFEAWAKSQNWVCDRNSFGEYQYGTATDGWAAWQAARRAAPVLGYDGLPSLPDAWGTMYGNGETLEERTGYTADQMRGYAIDAIATDRAARAQQQESSESCGQCPRDTPYGPAMCGKCLEDDKQQAQSVDTPEFVNLVSSYLNCRCNYSDLVAYIDGRTAGAAPEGWKLVPVEPTPEMLKAGRGSSGLTPYVWADMLAAAPSPQQGKEGGK